jgi:hypothetical protein
MTNIDPDGEWYLSGPAWPVHAARRPGFRPPHLWFARLSDLVKRLTKRFEVSKDGNQLMVRDIA